MRRHIAAGVRSRHGDDDGGQGRDQAGLPGDGRRRREVRSEGLHAGGGRLLHDAQGPDAVVAVQQLDDGVLLQQGRVREGRARPEPRAGDLARGGRRRRASSRRRAQQCAFTTGWQSWVQLESFSAWHNVPFATKQNGFGGIDAEARVQRPAAGAAHREPAGLGEEGLLHLRRPQERGRGQVLQRRMRDADDLELGRVRQHHRERQVQVRRVAAAVLRRRRRRAAEHDHRRRHAVGDGAARRRTSTRAWRSSSPTCRSPRCRPSGTRHRLPADHDGRLRADRRSRASTRRTRAPTSRSSR